MTITEPSEQVKALVAALKKAGVVGDCPVCGDSRWFPLEEVVAHKADTPAGDDGWRALGIVCTRCGYTRFHDESALKQHILD